MNDPHLYLDIQIRIQFTYFHCVNTKTFSIIFPVCINANLKSDSFEHLFSQFHYSNFHSLSLHFKEVSLHLQPYFWKLCFIFITCTTSIVFFNISFALITVSRVYLPILFGFIQESWLISICQGKRNGISMPKKKLESKFSFLTWSQQWHSSIGSWFSWQSIIYLSFHIKKRGINKAKELKTLSTKLFSCIKIYDILINFWNLRYLLARTFH